MQIKIVHLTLNLFSIILNYFLGGVCRVGRQFYGNILSAVNSSM